MLMQELMAMKVKKGAGRAEITLTGGVSLNIMLCHISVNSQLLKYSFDIVGVLSDQADIYFVLNNC